MVRKQGRSVILDWKTSGARWAKDKADKSLQATVYAYAYSLLHDDEPQVQFNVVVKRKKPVLEQHTTRRTQDDYHRLVELVKIVEKMIAAGVFAPNETSFYCKGCPHQSACRAWHRKRSRTISAAA